MSMIPFFPALKPTIANCLWFEVDAPCNEEADVLQLERDQHAWVNSISTAAADLHPLGKVSTFVGPETDDEDANDDSDDSDSHDEEDDDEIDRLVLSHADNRVRLETPYPPSDPQSPTNDDGNMTAN